MPVPTSTSPAYARYVLGILFLAYVLNFVDRQILSILLEPIKEELDVSDSAMGFLTGTAFALFYATAGIPIARWADVSPRRTIISLGLAAWSAMTVLSGLVQSFAQMALARVGVGVGEAALSPPAHSLIADYYPPERRATAMGIYSMGIHIGILFGLLAGGWLEQFWGWRRAFFVVGIPGLVLAVVVRLSVREPARGGLDVAPASEAVPDVGAVMRSLWSLRSFRHLSLASGLTAFAGYALGAWGPTFLRRVHELPGGEIGTKFGLVLGVGGAIGSVLAGLLADRLGQRDVRWWLRVPAVAALGPQPFVIGFLFVGQPDLALVVLFPGLVLASLYQGPVFATVQALAEVRMRSVASAVLLFVINIIGLALGPQAVGVLNDTLFASRGDAAVAYSLALVAGVMGVWGCVHFLIAARALPGELRRG
jgi:MFS family permease